MQSTMIRNTECDDYKPFIYLSPTSFVEKFLAIVDVENIILAEENKSLIDLNESLWVSYDSDFVKKDRFNKDMYVISPMFVSLNKYCIFDRNDIRKIFKAKNVFIKVHESKILENTDGQSILAIDLKSKCFINKDGDEIEYHPSKALIDSFFVAYPEIIRERIAKRSIKI